MARIVTTDHRGSNEGRELVRSSRLDQRYKRQSHLHGQQRLVCLLLPLAHGDALRRHRQESAESLSRDYSGTGGVADHFTAGRHDIETLVIRDILRKRFAMLSMQSFLPDSKRAGPPDSGEKRRPPESRASLSPRNPPWICAGGWLTPYSFGNSRAYFSHGILES